MAEKVENSIERFGRRDFVKYGVAFAAGLVALVRVASPRDAFAQAAPTKPDIRHYISDHMLTIYTRQGIATSNKA